MPRLSAAFRLKKASYKVQPPDAENGMSGGVGGLRCAFAVTRPDQPLGRCIAPESLIGMGGTDKLPNSVPGSYRFVEHRRYLDALLEALDVRERVTLVHHLAGPRFRLGQPPSRGCKGYRVYGGDRGAAGQGPLG